MVDPNVDDVNEKSQPLEYEVEDKEFPVWLAANKDSWQTNPDDVEP